MDLLTAEADRSIPNLANIIQEVGGAGDPYDPESIRQYSGCAPKGEEDCANPLLPPPDGDMTYIEGNNDKCACEARALNRSPEDFTSLVTPLPLYTDFDDRVFMDRWKDVTISGFTQLQTRAIRHALAFMKENRDLVRWSMCYAIGQVSEEFMPYINGSEGYRLYSDDGADDPVAYQSRGSSSIFIPVGNGNPDDGEAWFEVVTAAYQVWATRAWNRAPGGVTLAMVASAACATIDLAGTILHELWHVYGRAQGDEPNLGYHSYLIENCFRWAAFNRYSFATSAGCCEQAPNSRNSYWFTYGTLSPHRPTDTAYGFEDGQLFGNSGSAYTIMGAPNDQCDPAAIAAPEGTR